MDRWTEGNQTNGSMDQGMGDQWEDWQMETCADTQATDNSSRKPFPDLSLIGILLLSVPTSNPTQHHQPLSNMCSKWVSLLLFFMVVPGHEFLEDRGHISPTFNTPRLAQNWACSKCSINVYQVNSCRWVMEEREKSKEGCRKGGRKENRNMDKKYKYINRNGWAIW